VVVVVVVVVEVAVNCFELKVQAKGRDHVLVY
jgi:hypothetical protein